MARRITRELEKELKSRDRRPVLNFPMRSYQGPMGEKERQE